MPSQEEERDSLFLRKLSFYIQITFKLQSKINSYLIWSMIITQTNRDAIFIIWRLSELRLIVRRTCCDVTHCHVNLTLRGYYDFIIGHLLGTNAISNNIIVSEMYCWRIISNLEQSYIFFLCYLHCRTQFMFHLLLLY